MGLVLKLVGQFQTVRTLPRFSGDYTAGETPLPIPNREDKPRRADGTIRATVWESRSLPGLFEKASLGFQAGLLYFLVLVDSCGHRVALVSLWKFCLRLSGERVF